MKDPSTTSHTGLLVQKGSPSFRIIVNSRVTCDYLHLVVQLHRISARAKERDLVHAYELPTLAPGRGALKLLKSDNLLAMSHI
jgi:hypothetical protein